MADVDTRDRQRRRRSADRDRRLAWRALVVATLAGAITFGVAVSAGAAQTASIAGTWSTSGDSGWAAQYFVITDAGGTLGGAVHSGAPGGKGKPFARITGSDSAGSVFIQLTYTTFSPGYVATLRGTVSADGSSMSGTWKDNGGGAGTWMATRVATPSTGTPVLAHSVVAAAVSGHVLVERPGAHGFVALTGSSSVPVGSIVNVTSGRIRLTAATAAGSATQSSEFYGGEFKLMQARSGLTSLALTGGTPCAAHAARAAAANGKLRQRKLWGVGHGAFQTVGHFAAATVLGTKWLISDTCAGTQVYVAEGEVRVTNLVTHRTQIVTGGMTVTVRAPGAGPPPLPKTHSTYASAASTNTFHLTLITSASSATTLVSGPQPPPVGSQYPEATGVLPCPKAPPYSTSTPKPYAGFGFPGATLALMNGAYSFSVSWTIPSENVTFSNVPSFAMHLTMSGTVTGTDTIAGTFDATGGPCAPLAPIRWTATLDPSLKPAPGKLRLARG
jgi:hypothetical protein